MKFLVTGATGFLGSHICKRLQADGHDVQALVRPNSNLSRLDGLGIGVVRGDVTDPSSVQAAVPNRGYVIHAAADLNYWRQDPGRQMNVNVEGTRNVAQACRIAGVKRMLHVSSAGAIGIPLGPDGAANEEFEFNLQDSGLPYHISKRLAEERVMTEVGRDLDAVVVNPASITGPMRIERLLKSVRRSPVTPCFSGGNCVVHIDDVVDGIMAALEKGRSGQRYILGGENLTFRAMSEKAARMLGLARWFVRIPPVATGLAAAVMEPWARWRHRPPRFAHMIHYCANRFMFYDSGKARRELGYQPRDFDAILRQSIGDPLAH